MGSWMTDDFIDCRYLRHPTIPRRSADRFSAVRAALEEVFGADAS